MKKSTYLLAAVLMVAICSGATLAKPNFTGEWKMNASKSDFGQMPAPSSMTQKVTHDEPQLKVTTSASTERGDYTTEAAYTTDGKECVNSGRMGPIKSTLKWDGDALMIDSKMDFQGNPVSITDKWTLSEDGKTLTVNRHFSGPMGEADAKLVFEK